MTTTGRVVSFFFTPPVNAGWCGSVEIGGPGDKGGIEQHDVIAAVNGKPVESVGLSLPPPSPPSPSLLPLSFRP